jgi:hypothetical protein
VKIGGEGTLGNKKSTDFSVLFILDAERSGKISNLLVEDLRLLYRVMIRKVAI